MTCKTRRAVVAAFLLLAGAWTASADPVRLVVVTGNGQVVADASARFTAAHGPELLDVHVTAGVPDLERLTNADVIYVYYAANDVVKALAQPLADVHARGVPVLGAPRESVEREWPFTLEASVNDPANQYWQYGGTDNIASFLAYAYRLGGGTRPVAVDEARPMPTQGIYHPKAPQVFTTLTSYLAWYRQSGLAVPDAPLAAVTFYSNNVRFHDTAHIDALVQAIETRGMGAVPIFGWPVSQLRPLFFDGDRCGPGVLLSLNLTVYRSDDAAFLEACDAHVINLVVTQDTYDVWAAAPRGLPAERVPVLLNVPERSGASEPLLVATTEVDATTGSRVSRPVPERIARAADRARRWLALRTTANADKRLAILYYNNPPGRGNLGASYLQIAPTIATLLDRLRAEGYDVGQTVPTSDQLLDLLQRNARNIELWAPGELEALVDTGTVTLIPLRQYREWFATLPQAFREAVNVEWGPPEVARLMTVRRRGELHFVVPGLTFGNVFVGPQPLRSTFERAQDLAHDPMTPVPHVYVAAYMHYRHTLGVDAIVHIGRHGTLEWLPGKQVAQDGSDHSEVLLGELPNPYLYIVDGGGEAIQAKRRGAAVMMSHLTPLVVSGGEQERFAALHRMLEDYERAGAGADELQRETAVQIRQETTRRRLDRELGLAEDIEDEEFVRQVHEFLHTLEHAPIPSGIHALGSLPVDDVLTDAVREVLRYGLTDTEADAVAAHLGSLAALIVSDSPVELPRGLAVELHDKLAAGIDAARTWVTHVRASADAEVAALPRVLAGRYLPTGPLGDPLRTPSAVPTGRNLHAFDSAAIPTRAAWTLGRKMADQMVERYQSDHGRMPEQVSLVLWYGETEKHQGAMESMALDLLGVEPVWSTRGTLDGLRLVPDDELRRPRVDVLVTVSGIYRDGFPDKVLLLDRAVRLAASAGPSAITRHDATAEAALTGAGVSAEQAVTIARARVFGNPPGHYGIGVQRMVEQSADAGRSEDLAALYLHNMSHAFSADGWGVTAPGALAVHLENNDAVLFSRSGNLYGALDNDDTYGYVGGLNLATKTVSGRAPAFYIHNLRKAGAEAVVDMQTWLATELNARAWNPKWLTAMQASGYAGAREMFKELEHLYGFQATSPEQMDGEFWQKSFDVYVADVHGLDMAGFFERANPHAKQWMLARLLEVDRQGSYSYSDEDRERMVTEYIRSVNSHGVSCSANTCGNLAVHQFIGDTAASIPGLGAAELRAFGQRLAAATGWSSRSFPSAPRALAEGLRNRPPAVSEPPPPASLPPPEVTPPPTVRGRVLEERRLTLAATLPADRAHVTPLIWLAAVIGVIAGAVHRWRQAE